MHDKVSMEDIAAKLGITKNTVSLVFRNMPGISEKTRKSVLETAKQLGYKYKKDLKNTATKKTPLRNICLLQSKSTYDTTGFFAFIQLGIEAESKKNGLNLMLHIYDDSDENFEVPMCISEGLVSGVITIVRVRKTLPKYSILKTYPWLWLISYYEENILY